MDGTARDGVAVVGMACRFPGATDHRQYWRNLVDGVESITFFTDEQLRERGVAESVIADPLWVRAASLIEGIDEFDARFFGYTAREAEIRDPQGRLFLETCHAALEDGGYDPARHPGTVGVFGGSGVNEYWERVRRDPDVWAALGRIGIETGNGVDYLTTTVSYRLDLRGPSVAVQTACSSSLVAVHLAGRSLLAGECDLALAGGAEIPLSNRSGYFWSEGGINSRDGHCRAFDADASGTVFGSGVGVVLLKRLADAIADRDHIYAVLRGSAVNNDGAGRGAFTAPGVDGQARLLAAAYAEAGVEPATVDYVEAHGTGTLVGDPIELAALRQVFDEDGRRPPGWCRIGSVKPNIGHLGTAAGVAGLMKVCLALAHEAIPPNINFQRPNPRIDFAHGPFTVDTTLTPWPRRDTPRRAGVSGFGIGGTNAHLVLEEPPAPAPVPVHPRRRQVIVVSAKTADALTAASRQLGRHLTDAGAQERLAEVAHTLQTGRGEHPYRRAVVAGTVAEAADALATPVRGAISPARPRAVAYLFPGQGSQYPGMGRDLYRAEPAFRDAVDRCVDLLTPSLGLDLRSVMFAEDASPELLTETRFAQPALFTVAYAVAETLRTWGIAPTAMLGHSIGEWVAATLAGVFTLPDALALVTQRGRLMQAMPAGAMLAVRMPEDRLAEILPDGLEIAAVNAPSLTVVSGPVEAVEVFRGRLTRLAVPATPVHTSHAFHSRSMEPILDEFAAEVAAVARSTPAVPFISNVTGAWITAEQATDPRYWADQVRAPVRFADGLRTLAEDPDRLLLEVGPGDFLTGLATRTLRDSEVPAVATMRGPRPGVDDETVLAGALGRLWAAGVSPDWDGYWADGRPGRTSLPTYPFERQRYWLDEPAPDPADREPEPATLPAGEAIYSVRWQERSLPPGGGPVAGTRWLVLSSGAPALEEVCERLAAAGARVSVAVPGNGFARVGEDRYTVRPAEPADLRQLLAAVSTDDGPPERIVHGLAMTGPASEPLAPATVAAAADTTFYSLLHLAQAAGRHRTGQSLRLFAVSANLQDVTGSEPLEPAKALLLGPSLLIGRELPGMHCRSVDLALPSPLPVSVLADQLLAELVSDRKEPQVAWRGRRRWVWDHERIPLDPPAGEPAVLRERGVYLVTGGLGGLGLAVAEDLARRVKARLVLVGRTGVPDRAEWPALLDSPDTPELLRQRLERLRRIEAAGGELLVRACDVTDERQLTAVVDEATARFGAVHGVFHSAGVPSGGLLALRTREQAEQVLAPKVAGTLALHRVLAGRVDFLVLFSSVAAVTGDFGLVDYAAANSFQDAFARYASARGEPVYSIGWGLWASGMGDRADGSSSTVVRELHSGVRSSPVDHPLLDRRLHDGDNGLSFATTLRPDSHWILTEHTVAGVPVVPGTALVEMIRAAYAEAVGGPVTLRDVVFLGPVAVTGPVELRVELRPGPGGYDVTVSAGSSGAGRVVRVKARATPGEDGQPPVRDLAALAARCDRERPGHQASPSGLVQFGPHWHNLRSVRVGEGEQLGRVSLAEPFRSECDEYGLHPALLDDAVSNAGAPLAVAPGDSYLPMSYGTVVVRAPLPPEFLVHVRRLEPGGDQITTDLSLLDASGRELVRVDRYVLRRVDPEALRGSLAGAGEPAPSATPPAGDFDWAIAEPDGLDALCRVLHHRPKPHLIVCPEGLERHLRRVDQLTGDQVERQVGTAHLAAPAGEDRIVDTPYVAPESELQELLAGMLRNALGVRQVGIDDDFFAMGGNSLVAVQLGFRLREHFDLEIPVASLLEQPTVRGLAAALDRMLREKVATLSAEEAAALLEE